MAWTAEDYMAMLKTFSNFLISFVPPVFVMLIVYTMLSLMHFEDNTTYCTISHWKDMDKLDVNAISIIFVVTMSMYGILNQISRMKDKTSTGKRIQYFFAWVASSLTIVLLVFSQLALYSSYCYHPVSDGVTILKEEVRDVNGPIDAVEYAAISALFLLLVFAIYDFVDVVESEEGENEDSKTHGWLDQGVMRYVSYFARAAFVTSLFAIYIKDDFGSITGMVNSTECMEQICAIHDDTWFKRYEAIELAEINTDHKNCTVFSAGKLSIEKKPEMENLAISIFVFTCVELLGMFVFSLATLDACTSIELSERNKEIFRMSIRIMSLLVNISLAIFTFSLIIANNIAACPILNYHDDDGYVAMTQVFASIFLSVQFVILVVKEYVISETNQSDPVVRFLFGSRKTSSMYSQLTQTFM